ncbi:MAG: HAD-IIIC family phosphatase, partial [Acidobacteriaceae bacterium]
MPEIVDNTQPQSGVSSTGRRSASEEAVAGIWAEVLRLPGARDVASDANFFDIGGDSMKAMEVILRAGEALGVDLPLMAFFEEPTVAHLAAVVDELKGRGTAAALAEIWSGVLRLTGIAGDANFFDIGGDSMKAMEVIARVGEVFGVELPLMAFFEEPTLTHLASVIDDLKGSETGGRLERVPGRREFPLSYSQQVFWLLAQQVRGTGLYNTARIFRVRGKVDAAILERSLNELRRRHEILQVRFVSGMEGPVQVVDAGAPLHLEVSDVSALGAEAAERAALGLALETVREPFDLEAGPVLRTRLVRLSAEDSLLCMAIHHVVSDGFTGSILLEELAAIYDAFVEGQPNPLPELDLHFTDYAAWEREWMSGMRLDEELNYWSGVLKGAPASIDLPSAGERSFESDRRGHLKTAMLPLETLEKLQALAQSNGTTLFTILSAGFRILLSRWSGQNDFLIGTIASNRSRSHTERMVGCFVNPLALRNAIADGESVRDVVRGEKSAVMDAFAHQDCPFAKIVEAVNPERTSGDNPLFNVALLLQSFPAIAVTGRNFRAEDINFDAQTALLDLRFIATETATGLQVDCEYSTELFESATIDELFASFESVLIQMVDAPETAVAKIGISDDLARRGAEHRRAKHRQTIAIAANFTAEPVEEALEFWMDELRTPSRIEFAPFDQVFQQLLDPGSLLGGNADGVNIVFIQWRDGHAPGDQARELAAALKVSAARRKAPILVCVCPPEVSDEEQVLAAELAGHAGVHVVYSRQILELYPVENYRDTFAEAVGAIPYTPEFFVALASMAARRMYALRSTPYKVIALDCDNTLWKGVCGEEGALGVEIDAPRRVLQEFMRAQRDAGMVLCLASKNAEADVDAVFASNPGMLLRREDFVAARVNWQSKSENLRDLARELNLGLDSFILIDDNPLECAEVRANCPGALVLELPADDAKIPEVLRQMWAFDHWNVTAEDRQRSELYQQERQREQSRGGAGDLAEFLRGLELKIDIRPMGPEDVTRVSQLTQRTNQFNCTTIRRSESEIESAVEEGAECLVVEVRDRFGDYGLVGVAIFAAQADALVMDTLLMSCRALGRKVEHNILARLGGIALERGLERVDVKFIPTAKNRPALDFLESVGSQFRSVGKGASLYRFPAAYANVAHELVAASPEVPQEPGVEVASAPVAPRADLERIATELGGVSAIARAIQSRPVKAGVETTSGQARNATEEILAGIWARVLRISAPGIRDDFFRLGGNSLLAVQVLSRVRQTLGVEVPLRAMFETPTLVGLAQRIEAARRAHAGTVAPALVKIARQGNVAASFAQQRLWFLDQLEPDNPIYNIPQMLRMTGPLNVDALQRSLSEIVRRHEALRTTFEAADGQPMQVIGPAPGVRISLTDLSDLLHLSEERRESEMQRLALEEAVRPFDLAHGLMLRARLLRRAPEDHVLLIVLHHIAGDRWSAGILAEEMEALYAAYVQDEPSPLQEPPVQYADFSEWQRGWLQGPELEKQAAYWRQQLAGAPAVMELPTDRSRPALLSHKGKTETALLPQDLVDKLTALSQGEGVTLFMTLLAAFQLLLGRYSGQDDIVVGSPIAGRNVAEVEQLIGFFVNTLALRTDLSGDPSFRELLQRVRGVALNAYAHQDIPFERLVEELQPERSLSYQPIFQVVFALQNAPQRSLELAELHLERLPLHQGTSAFDMSWFATHVAGGMQMRVEYNTDLFDTATITRAIGHFGILLETIVAHPEQHLSELEFLGEQERGQILVAFNATATEFPLDLCIHDLVTQQAHRTPDAVALVDGERRVSYGELNARANQIAH